MNDVQEQLAAELSGLLERLRGIKIGGLSDSSKTLQADTDNLANDLQDDDKTIVTAASQAVVAALFGNGEPLLEWWTSTPMGTICAKALLDEHQPISWSYGIAADTLGLAKSTISTVAARGRITKHPRGGLVPASVISYGENRRPYEPREPRERDYRSCGTINGYQQHHYHQEPTCRPCRDAWNLHKKENP
jgi:hypothetical protein